MKKLFAYADLYISQCTWKDLALVKFCLASIGVLLGLQVAGEKKKPVGIAAAAVFVVTYVPLMTKFIRIVLEKVKEEREILEL